ncbi:MAG: tetratricopeptide repeat protein [Methanoregula sp.]|nr:tetratricopeptide repeat protein [Methanoregula sp.]
MKFRQFIHILAIFALIACFITPVLAADAAPAAPADEATTYYNAGAQLLNSGDYERAIGSFDLALASNTTLIKSSEALLYTYRNKGYAQIQLKKYNEAIQTFEQGLALYPKDQMLWNNKGYANYNLGKFTEALTSYDNALRFEKNYTIALINKGDTLSKMGQFQSAVDTYKLALETDPGNRDATAGLAAAQQAAASEIPTTMIVIIVLVIIIAGVAVWYIKFRKPDEPKPAEKKSKGKKK